MPVFDGCRFFYGSWVQYFERGVPGVKISYRHIALRPKGRSIGELYRGRGVGKWLGVVGRLAIGVNGMEA